MSSGVSIKAVTPVATVGEGPYWDEGSGTLLYVDIPSGKVLRYFPETGQTKELTVAPDSTGKAVSFVLPCDDDPDLLLIGHGRSVSAVHWSADAPLKSAGPGQAITAVDEGQQTRFNDAKCDPSGRVWAGTMGFETAPGKPEMYKGSLYRISASMEATACVDKVSISNGLAWAHDKKTFYYIDTCNLAVEGFDYDDATGEIGNRRTVFDYKKNGLTPDLPDGMTIDGDGNLWVANFYGGKVICINPSTGKLLRSVAMPVQNITSVCWGGADYSTLYVTTSTLGLSEQQLKDAPQSGAVFAVTGLGCNGLPPVKAVVAEAVLKDVAVKINKV